MIFIKKQISNTLFFSIVIILAAQININLFTDDFKIAIAVICLSTFALIIEEFPLVPVTILSTVGIFTLRTLIYWIQYAQLPTTGAFMPEISFYLCYGFLLYLYIKYSNAKPGDNLAASEATGEFEFSLKYLHTLATLCFIDYFANLTELTFRLNTGVLSLRTQAGILLAAFVRAFITWCLLLALDLYRQTLLQREQEKRYRRLVLLISQLNGEVVWMKKNTALIEATMNTSYRLFEELKKNGADPKLTSSALSTAKDIHEIKKEYLLIMRGISDALDMEFENDDMQFEELIGILKNSLTQFAKDQGHVLQFTQACEKNFYTDKHYALLSIFRNLMINAIEASKEFEVRICVNEQIIDQDYLFDVTDNGPGIPEALQEEVFKTGFSTKINYETGEVSRGLGLNLVRDLVEHELGGEISLSSVPGKTTFSIRIPKLTLEVKKL